MTTLPPARYGRLARVADLTTANLLAARLDAEGIEVRVHSEAKGPYPMTVGEFAAAERWVLNDSLDDARTIMLDAEVKDTLGRVDPPTETGRGGRMPVEMRLLAILVLVVLAVLFVLRWTSVY